MLGENPGADASRKDNTTGKGVKDATAAYRDAKKSGIGLHAATNSLSNAMDKLLFEAADRATWGQRQTASRHAGWSPTMAKHTAALKFLQKSKDWQIPHLQAQMSELPEEQRNKLPFPWGNAKASRDPKGARKAWLKDAQEAEKKSDMPWVSPRKDTPAPVSTLAQQPGNTPAA